MNNFIEEVWPVRIRVIYIVVRSHVLCLHFNVLSTETAIKTNKPMWYLKGIRKNKLFRFSFLFIEAYDLVEILSFYLVNYSIIFTYKMDDYFLKQIIYVSVF